LLSQSATCAMPMRQVLVGCETTIKTTSFFSKISDSGKPRRWAPVIFQTDLPVYLGMCKAVLRTFVVRQKPTGRPNSLFPPYPFARIPNCISYSPLAPTSASPSASSILFWLPHQHPCRYSVTYLRPIALKSFPFFPCDKDSNSIWQSPHSSHTKAIHSS
jgi:hypothetical protein